MRYYDYSQHEDALFREAKVYYRGIFFSGALIDLECRKVSGERITRQDPPAIPGFYFKTGARYDLRFGDPLLIEGLEYVGVGMIDLSGPNGSFMRPIENSFYIFLKGDAKVYVQTSYYHYEVQLSPTMKRVCVPLMEKKHEMNFPHKHIIGWKKALDKRDSVFNQTHEEFCREWTRDSQQLIVCYKVERGGLYCCMGLLEGITRDEIDPKHLRRPILCCCCPVRLFELSRCPLISGCSGGFLCGGDDR